MTCSFDYNKYHRLEYNKYHRLDYNKCHRLDHYYHYHFHNYHDYDYDFNNDSDYINDTYSNDYNYGNFSITVYDIASSRNATHFRYYLSSKT